jgi:peptidoglycan/xylan/chitin deacetylase (PgdA/CDA1 family)
MTALVSSPQADAQLPVLMYHSIPPSRHVDNDLEVPLHELKQQLATLRADGYAVTGLTRALKICRSDPRRRVIALTFDHGYVDFLGAAEALVQFDCAATLYVPTAHVGTAGLGLGRDTGRLLTWAELADLPRDYVEIGSHSHDHRPLDVLPVETTTAQLRTSREQLQDRLGLEVTSFCYPHGYSSHRLRTAVRSVGYSNACIVGRRLARAADNPFAVPRLQVRPGTGPQALRRLVRTGERGVAPTLRTWVQPAWRLVRVGALLGFGREFT